MRDIKELAALADKQPYDALLFITLDEVRQFTTSMPSSAYRVFGSPLNFMGRRCIISDLPPNHYLSNDGKVLPL